MAKDDLIRFDPDDPRFKAEPYGAVKPEREQRKLSPENEKAAAEFSPLKSFARSAANAAMFGGGDRLASWLKGENVQDTREMSARAREQNPKSSVAGDITGNVLREIPMMAGGAALAPARLGASTFGAGARLGGLTSGAGALAEESIKAAEGDRGDFSVGNIAAATGAGALGGGVGNQLPALFGHAKTMLSKTGDAPLSAAQKAAMEDGLRHGQHYGFKGDAALDLAQQARFTEDPGLATMASKMERIKGRANPSFQEAQENAFAAGGLDKLMDASVPKQAVRGVNKGAYQQYPEMSGKIVGQSRNSIPGETVLPTRHGIPDAAQKALDEAYESRRAVWEAQNRYGTWGKGVGPRPEPQRGEFKMWEDVLDPKKNPMSREDLRHTRAALAGDSSLMSQRMATEQMADDVAQVRGAVRNAPAAPSNVPDSVPLSAGIPFLKGLGRIGVDVPLPKMTARNTRASELMRDPSMADIIGRLTGVQGASSLASRATLEELIRSLNGSSRRE
jgi:hypothetical protein